MWNFDGNFWHWKKRLFWPKVTFLFLNVPWRGSFLRPCLSLVCNLCIRLVWLCHHNLIVMLGTKTAHILLPWTTNCNITYSFVAKVIYTLLLSRKLFTHLFCRKTDLRTFLSRKRFTHSVQKVFARWNFWASSLGIAILEDACQIIWEQKSKLNAQ